MTQRHHTETNQGTASQAIDTAKQKAAQATDAVKQQASQALDKAEQQTKSLADERKGRAADNLSGVADAFRHTGDQLRGQDHGEIAQLADRAADRVDRIAGYMRDRSIGEMIDDAERMARREPEMFLIGAFALGLLGARFLKSSGHHAHDTGGMARAQGRGRGAYPSAPTYSRGTRFGPYSTQGPAPYATGPRIYQRREE